MKKIYLAIVILLSLLLIGCTNKKEVIVEKVEVPVYSCPVIIFPSMPVLAIQTINKKSSNASVLKAYGRTVDQLINYSSTIVDIIKKQNELSNEKYSK